MVVEVIEEEKGVNTNQMVRLMEESPSVDVGDYFFLVSCG